LERSKISGKLMLTAWNGEQTQITGGNVFYNSHGRKGDRMVGLLVFKEKKGDDI